MNPKVTSSLCIKMTSALIYDICLFAVAFVFSVGLCCLCERNQI